MPWKEVKPMDEKILFVADCIRDVASMSELCRRYGISRKTGYKWLARYSSGGAEALVELSCRPQGSPAATPYRVVKEVIELRKRGRTEYGARKIRSILIGRHRKWEIPSKTTIHNILKREGLVHPKKSRRRVSPSALPFIKAQQPNDLWSTDYKGEFRTLDHKLCYPLTVMDHTSRFVLGCKGLQSTKTSCARAEFELLFHTYGLPVRIRSDNGVPFATTAVGGLSQLSIWWIRLGIMPERIEPGKPQQNGAHERMHRTLKDDTTKPPGRSLKHQQEIFDRFVLQYNMERPHESLDDETPGSRYEASHREMPEKLPDLEYEPYLQVKRVSSSGLVYLNRMCIYISAVLKGEEVGLEEVGDGMWDVYFGPIRLGSFDQRDAKENSYGYISLRKL